MKIKHVFTKTICVVLSLFLIGTLSAQPLSTYATYVPANVTIGMTVEALSSTRPQAVYYGTFSYPIKSTDMDFEMGEVSGTIPPFPAISYHFKNRTLKGYSWVYSGSDYQSFAQRVKTEMLAGFSYVGVEAVTTVVTTNAQTLNIERWSKDEHTHAFLLVADTVVQVVVFDPTSLSKTEIYPVR